jgi:hypothetical protein
MNAASAQADKVENIQMDEKMTNSINALKNWLAIRNPQGGEIGFQQDLIDTKVVDSISFTEFVYYIEELSGREINIQQETLMAFRTLASISSRFFAQGISA